MSNEQQEGLRVSFPSKGTSQLQRSQGSLNDVANVVNDVASSYDVQYTELCHMLEEVVDSVECIKQHRLANITGLRDDIEQLVNAVDTARRSATDTNSLERHREEVQRLESEKKRLVAEILAGKDEEEELRSKLNRVEQQMASTRHECDSVKGQTESEVPSLEYMKKVLHRLSQVYLTSREDSRITKGFVSQKGANDIRPFCFDESTSHFDQVNNLWEIISEECC